MAFSVTQRALVQSLADYLNGNHDLPIDSRVVENLAKIYDGSTGFPSSCGIRGNDLRSSLRDEPIRTFLRLLIATSDGALTPCSGGAAAPASPPAVAGIVCPTVVDLLTAKTYAVLSSTPDVSNSGFTTLSGNLGVSPAAAVIGFPPGVVINGTTHAADVAAGQARADLTAA